MSFEQRMEHRLEKQLRLAEESNNIFERIATALERMEQKQTTQSWTMVNPNQYIVSGAR